MSPPPQAGPPSPPPPSRAKGPQQRTTPRAQLAAHASFAEVSPEVGLLDEDAFDRAVAADPDSALVMLVDMARATDEGLRRKARALAGRVVLDRARAAAPRAAGVRTLRSVRADVGGDLDVDASLEAVAAARAEGRPPGLDELVARTWGSPELALCLVVDSSGSMGGARLAAAALTAAACAWRAPGEHAVLSFAREVRVLRSLDGQRPAAAVVDDVLSLRGHGTTSLSDALREASSQLSRSRAGRKVVVLLSDCRATDEADPAAVASTLPELVVLAPAEDTDAAEALAARAGARWAALTGADAAPRLLAALLE